jgi:hypothetical protein
MSQYLIYPPNGPLPLPGSSVEYDPDCDVWDDIFNAALMINPAFNMYRIFDVVSSLQSEEEYRFLPLLVSDPLGCSWIPRLLHQRTDLASVL